MTGNAWVAMLVEEPGFDVLAEKERTEAISDVAGLPSAPADHGNQAEGAGDAAGQLHRLGLRPAAIDTYVFYCHRRFY
jgi:hypothetical protein